MFNFQMENHHRFVVQELLEQNERLEEALNNATNCSESKQEVKDSFGVEKVREIPVFEGNLKK